MAALGLVLPMTPLAAWFGFVPLPWTYYAFVAGAVATYLLLVQVVKTRLLAHGRGAVDAGQDVARP